MADFCFEKEVSKEVLLWVRLPKLPLTYWSGDSLSRIGSVLGKPICVDECTSQQKRISYARMLVEIDITQPLTYKIQIKGEGGLMLDQQVLYEWAPMSCQKCHKVGHICMEKKQDIVTQNQKQKQWQPKDKGKGVMVESEGVKEDWSKPKKSTTSIQVEHLQVLTTNTFQELNSILEGGNLFPSNIT